MKRNIEKEDFWVVSVFDLRLFFIFHFWESSLVELASNEWWYFKYKYNKWWNMMKQKQEKEKKSRIIISAIYFNEPQTRWNISHYPLLKIFWKTWMNSLSFSKSILINLIYHLIFLEVIFDHLIKIRFWTLIKDRELFII